MFLRQNRARALEIAAGGGLSLLEASAGMIDEPICESQMLRGSRESRKMLSPEPRGSYQVIDR